MSSRPDAGYNLPDLGDLPVAAEVLPRACEPARVPRHRQIIRADAGPAPFAARFDLHPLGEPMVLFNSHRFDADADPPLLTSGDTVPGPMPAARLDHGPPGGPARLRMSR